MRWSLSSLSDLAAANAVYVMEDPGVIQYWKKPSGKGVSLAEWTALYKSIEAGTTRFEERNIDKDLGKYFNLLYMTKL